MSTTSEYQAVGALEKFSGVSAAASSDLQGYLTYLDSLDMAGLDLPFPYTDLLFVKERYAVRASIMAPSPRDGLRLLLAEWPTVPLLVQDAGGSGPHAFQIVAWSEEMGNRPHPFAGWVEHMGLAVYAANQDPRFGTFFAAPLRAFSRG